MNFCWLVVVRLAPLIQPGDLRLVQHWNLVELVVLPCVVRVKIDQHQLLHLLPVLRLQDVLVQVELECVVVVVGVIQVAQGRVERARLTECRIDVLLDLPATLPIHDGECAVEVLEHHVDGAGDLELLVEDAPLGAVGQQTIHRLELFAEVVEIRHLLWHAFVDDHVGDGPQPIVVVLDESVHLGACGCCLVALLLPCLLDFVSGHRVVLAVLPVARRHHPLDDFIFVECWEVAVDECGGAHIASLAIDGVGVARLIKDDEVVAVVRVLRRKRHCRR